MAKRKRVGLVYSYDENWIAGAYYILNIVHALKTLDDADQPELIILTESLDNYEYVVDNTGYSYIEYYKYPPPKIDYTVTEQIINKLGKFLLKRSLILKFQQFPNIDFLYPRQIVDFSDRLKKVNWIPDFQEDYLPQFFSKNELYLRKKKQKEIYALGDIVVLSSRDAQSDFNRLYPNAIAKSFVLPFAVTHPDFSLISIEDLLVKYNLQKTYFFVPNQFWAHKNHIVILQAVKVLKEKGMQITVAMSGKESDYRNKENIDKLKDYVEQHGLNSEIKFLGFLPREDQLCLFKHAQAIIQPSLFEGWSTVIEDAKALGKFAIVSSLRVHLEQLHENSLFFNPNDYMDLVKCIESFMLNPPEIKPLDYTGNIFEFGKKFSELTEIATKQQED